MSQNQLDAYIKLLLKWNAQMNLIAKSTEPDIMQRHILDSAQLCDYIDANEPVIDLGSGAGFPGIVLSITKIHDVTLVESNSKKCTFLRMASLISHNKVSILNKRIEDLDLIGAPYVVTCRALASISQLLGYLQCIPYSRCLFLKGENYRDELTEAEKEWSFEYKIFKHQSIIIEIKNVKKI